MNLHREVCFKILKSKFRSFGNHFKVHYEGLSFLLEKKILV